MNTYSNTDTDFVRFLTSTGERDAAAVAAGERGGHERTASAHDPALLPPAAHLHARAAHAESGARARARLPRDPHGTLLT